MDMRKAALVFGWPVAVVACALLAWQNARKLPEGEGGLLRRADEICSGFGDLYEIEDIPRSEIAEALAEYLRVVEMDPKSARAYEGGAHCLLLLGAYDQATELLDTAKGEGVDRRVLAQISSDIGEYKAAAHVRVRAPAW